MTIMKSLLCGLLLGSSALAATIPAGPDPEPTSAQVEGPPKSTGTYLPIPNEIRASEINDYLHPDIDYTAGNLDCGKGEQVVSEGVVIGCHFVYTDEELNRAISAISEAKNLTNVVEKRGFEVRNQPPLGPLHKRDPWLVAGYFCHGSGVYTFNNDLTTASTVPCVAVDGFAGTYVRAASWIITQLPPDGRVFYAAGAPNVRIRVDYIFESLRPQDSWVHTSINGKCLWWYIWYLMSYCRGGSGQDTRGGWVEGYDNVYPSRHYRISADPNPIGGLG